MSSSPLPFAPFIEVLRGTESGDPDALANEWHFSIDGRTVGACCGSAEEAAYAAEQQLFQDHADVVEKYLQKFLEKGEWSLALQLVERRGFHAGAAQERGRIHAIIASSTHALNQEVSRGRRRGFGAQH
jgi:hypothetical protein